MWCSIRTWHASISAHGFDHTSIKHQHKRQVYHALRLPPSHFRISSTSSLLSKRPQNARSPYPPAVMPHPTTYATPYYATSTPPIDFSTYFGYFYDIYDKENIKLETDDQNPPPAPAPAPAPEPEPEPFRRQIYATRIDCPNLSFHYG